jgi:aconitate hydratase
MSTFDTKTPLSVNNKTYHYYSIPALKQAGLKNLERLPYSLKVLLENLLRNLDERTVTNADILAMQQWLTDKTSQHEIAYRPARVLMQDFTGVPAVVDLAAMRDALAKRGGNPDLINPLIPVDLVIDHSVQVDQFASPEAFKFNVEVEMERNYERYAFLRWGQTAFKNFRVVPPGTGICHQVNLEYLAQVVWQKTEKGETIAYPDTLVGTDSHTTMINGLGVLGWGVGGIEAEAAMLGQPVSMVIPEVIGVRLVGHLKEGIIATDLVLTVTQILRQRGVVGKFVEFFGPGLDELPLADRATIANMAPEYGATCGFFPVDQETLTYMKLTGRSDDTLALVEAYCKAQGLWRDANAEDPIYTDVITLDLSTIEPSLAGPKRPQDKVVLSQIGHAFDSFLEEQGKGSEKGKSVKANGLGFDMEHGDVAIAAITSCTNTSNPSALMAAGLLARNALRKGLTRKPWVKSSLAPGSKVVTDYLDKAGLQEPLNQLGFNLVGYGCTTCIGNSGPLLEPIEQAVKSGDLTVSAVLSGNRNFEGRVHPLVKANWLASPPLVVAFALAGTTRIDLTKEPLGQDPQGKPVYLKDIWPTNKEIAEEVNAIVNSDMYRHEYADVFHGDDEWRSIKVPTSKTYAWQPDSTYVRNPTFFENLGSSTAVSSVSGARILALLGDSITTDHISPAGSIKSDSPAGKYLTEHGVRVKDFNSYGSRRGNHEVMVRGTFANIRIRNEMAPGTEGGVTTYVPTGEVMPIFDASMKYQASGIPLVVIAGKEYGTGSSRDWAAKGTLLLGVKAVIAESYERIHRSNLIGMGVLPLEFTEGVTRKTLELKGDEIVELRMPDTIKPRMLVEAVFTANDGGKKMATLLCRIDTMDELDYYQYGGILPYVMSQL